MLFSLQKNLENVDSLLEMVHPLLIEELFQLFFFLNMDLLHVRCPDLPQLTG